MGIKNTENSYGGVAILFHWLAACGVIFLFSLGLWMDGLGYYDKYYRAAPHLHKSIGVLLVLLFVIRFIWRVINIQPRALASHKPWEVTIAKTVHYIFYLLIIGMFISGYLITTAEGAALEVFSWFSLPASITGIANLEDMAGEVHEFLAYTLILLVVLHMLAALKHHFLDKDSTLIRMLKTGDHK